MQFLNLSATLALAAPPGQSGQQQQYPVWTSLVPLVLLIVVFYFALIRPQQKKAKDQATMLKSVRAGDKVVTSGGLLGVVITVKDKSLSIRSADSKLEIAKSSVTEILERSGDSAPS